MLSARSRGWATALTSDTSNRETSDGRSERRASRATGMTSDHRREDSALRSLSNCLLRAVGSIGPVLPWRTRTDFRLSHYRFEIARVEANARLFAQGNMNKIILTFSYYCGT